MRVLYLILSLHFFALLAAAANVQIDFSKIQYVRNSSAVQSFQDRFLFSNKAI